MKTRVEQFYSCTKHEQILVVQKWLEATTKRLPDYYGQDAIKPREYKVLAYWDSVKNFPMEEYEKAREYARQLSLPAPENKIVVSFENGVCTNPEAPR